MNIAKECINGMPDLSLNRSAMSPRQSPPWTWVVALLCSSVSAQVFWSPVKNARAGLLVVLPSAIG